MRDDDAQDGDRLPGSPEHSANFALDYNTTVMSEHELNINYSAYYTGDIYTTVGRRGNSGVVDRDGNTQASGWGQELDSFWLHSISAMLTMENVDVSVYVDNLFNEDAVTAVRTDKSELRDIGNFALRSYGEYVTPPRTIGAKITYAF